MKRVIIKYSIGYGMHETDCEYDDDVSDEDIDRDVQEMVMERVDWSWKVASATK